MPDALRHPFSGSRHAYKKVLHLKISDFCGYFVGYCNCITACHFLVCFVQVIVGMVLIGKWLSKWAIYIEL